MTIDIEYRSTISNVNLIDSGKTFVSGNYAYVPSINNDYVVIFDISNPFLPEYKTHIDNTHIIGIGDIVVGGGRVTIPSENNDKLVRYNVTNPLAPIYEGFASSIAPVSIVLYGPEFLVGSFGNISYLSSTLVFFDDIGVSSNPSIFVTTDYSKFYAVTGYYNPGVLSIFDITGMGGNLELLGSTTSHLSASANSVYVSGDYAYVTESSDSNKLVVFNVTNPASPTYVTEISTGLSLPSEITGSGNYIYIASFANSKLVVFDISTPASPTYVTSITVSFPTRLSMFGNYLYVSSGNDVLIYEVGDFSSSNSSFSSSSTSYIKNWSSSSSSYSSSSSSSSSSLQYSSSSSSSSDEIITRPITIPLINQNNGDLIPFTWITEGGTGDNSELRFTIEASNSPYFDYNAIINRDNSSITTVPDTESDVYVPNNDVKYTHEKSFYVDVVAKDSGGIKNLRTHVEPNKYEFESVEEAGQVYRIPKFIWK